MITVTPITPQFCSSSRPTQLSWHNTWKQSFQAWCPSNHFISQWISYYRFCQKDRLYHFRCRPGPARGRYVQFCSWTGYLHNPTQAYFKGCINHGFIAGIRSIYHSASGDRMIQLRCCRSYGYKLGVGWRQYKKTSCINTSYINSFGQTVMNYQVPLGYILNGVGSYFNSFYKDRSWRFHVCKMSI
ncbi:hypothetical protein ACROYT_G036007 [Oculina patagonica]